jgi:hypothetical protein
VRVAVGVRVRSFQDQALVRHELVKRLHRAFAAHGVTWANPRTGIRPSGASPGEADPAAGKP